MKLLYITPKINEEGGIQKVLSVKTNYFIEKFNYQIDILTQDNGNTNLFFGFNKKIRLFDIKLSKNKFLKFIQYRNAIQNQIKISKPDVILVCDAGLKAFLIPSIIFTNKKIIYENHGSKFNESVYFKPTTINIFFRELKYIYKGLFIKTYDKVIFLSDESAKEWNLKNGVIISNPLDYSPEKVASLNPNKALIIARHSYEKGIDRVIRVWQIISKTHPNWILEIYGAEDISLGYKKLVKDNKITNLIRFFEPVKNISDKYLDASMYLMTSRQEGLPMVLIEAMSFGLPCIAYDCPVGPRAIITNNENGFLIENDNEEAFVNAIYRLIEDENLRLKMGKKAKISSKKYQIDAIMQQWKQLFNALIDTNTQS